MRYAMFLLAVALIAGCADRARRVDAAPPTVSYSYEDDEGLRDALRLADNYCDDRYDADARLVRSASERGRVTFACIRD